jgi:CO/xanthine dehydrogenase Mo-binding subunit
VPQRRPRADCWFHCIWIFPAFAQEGRPAPPPKVYPPDAFVRIEANGKIFITVNRLEFGQGVQTSLPMVLADELDADWSQVVPELAPLLMFTRIRLFGIQMVGGSGSISHSFQQYRELGAKTRAMLVAAAADRWKVSPNSAVPKTVSSMVPGKSRHAMLNLRARGAPTGARQSSPEESV